jgi:hypothetical protein
VGQKLWIGGGTPQGIRPNSALGQEHAQPFGVARDESERLNRNDFSYFPRVMSRFSQSADLPFPNLWSLFSKRSCPSLRKMFKQVETTLHVDHTRVAVRLNGLERIWR